MKPTRGSNPSPLSARRKPKKFFYGTKSTHENGLSPAFGGEETKRILSARSTKCKHTAVPFPPLAGKEKIALLFCKENETHGNTGMYQASAGRRG
jgi:hypothetical protein